MSLDQHIRYDDLVLQVGSLTAMMRVFMPSDVVPRPSVESAVAHAGDIVRGKVVAETVAFIGRAPQLSGHRIDRHTHAVADTSGIDPKLAAIRIELQHVG